MEEWEGREREVGEENGADGRQKGEVMERERERRGERERLKNNK